MRSPCSPTPGRRSKPAFWCSNPELVIGHAGQTDYVIVAMIQHQNSYQCRHMPQAEWDNHVAHNSLPAGVYYLLNATLQEVNAQHIWGMHATCQEVELLLERGWPCKWEVYNPPSPIDPK